MNELWGWHVKLTKEDEYLYLIDGISLQVAYRRRGPHGWIKIYPTHGRQDKINVDKESFMHWGTILPHEEIFKRLISDGVTTDG